MGEAGYVRKTGKGVGVISRFKELGIDLLDSSISRPWTPDGESALRDLFYFGLTYKQMAKELNRTWQDVWSRTVLLYTKGELAPDEWGKTVRYTHAAQGLWDGLEAEARRLAEGQN